MRAVILGLALAMAAGQVVAADEPAAADDGSKMVCKTMAQPGTRFKKKECRTRDEWEYLSKVSQEQFKKVQNAAQTPKPGN